MRLPLPVERRAAQISRKWWEKKTKHTGDQARSPGFNQPRSLPSPAASRLIVFPERLEEIGLRISVSYMSPFEIAGELFQGAGVKAAGPSLANAELLARVFECLALEIRTADELTGVGRQIVD